MERWLTKVIVGLGIAWLSILGIQVRASCPNQCPEDPDPNCFEKDPGPQIEVTFLNEPYEVEACCGLGGLWGEEAAEFVGIQFTLSDTDRYRSQQNDHWEQNMDCECYLDRDTENYPWQNVNDPVRVVEWYGTLLLEFEGENTLTLVVENEQETPDANGCTKRTYEQRTVEVQVTVTYPEGMTHPVDPAEKPEADTEPYGPYSPADPVDFEDGYAIYVVDLTYTAAVTYPDIIKSPNSSCNQEHTVEHENAASQGSELNIGGGIGGGLSGVLGYVGGQIEADTNISDGQIISVTIIGHCAAEPCMYNGLVFWQRHEYLTACSWDERWVNIETEEEEIRGGGGGDGEHYGSPIPGCHYRANFDSLPGAH